MKIQMGVLRVGSPLNWGPNMEVSTTVGLVSSIFFFDIIQVSIMRILLLLSN